MYKVMRNKEAEAIRDLAADILGWEREDVDAFSFRMLREVLLRRPEETAAECVKAIDWGLDPNNPHPLWVGDPERDPRAWERDPPQRRRNHPDPLAKYRR